MRGYACALPCVEAAFPEFPMVYLKESVKRFWKKRKKVSLRAINQFRCFARKVSKNNTQTCHILKCDIRKFFASIFLAKQLKLSLHKEKIFFDTWASGTDFLGWVHFPHSRVLRTSTRKKIFRNLCKNSNEKMLTSYCGLLSHGNTYILKKKLALFCWIKKYV